MTVRRASRNDIPSIVQIYGLDALTGDRELLSDPLPESYYSAFGALDRDENQLLLVAEVEREVLGSLQLTFVQHLIAQGFRRAVIEAFFVHPAHTGKGVGNLLIRASIEAAQERRCTSMELTSNKKRSLAHGFYAKVGFTPSHEGFKLALPFGCKAD